MKSLDPLYWRILSSGLVGIRNAALAGDLSWCRAEAEYLHNIPSLIGEENRERHLYFATQEREAYIEWLLSAAREVVRERALMCYGGEWREIDAILGLPEVSYDARLSRG